MKKSNIKKVTVTAMLTALAYLMTFVFKFKVMFLTFDLKDAIISLVSLMFGSVYGVFSAGVVSILEFATISDTGIYGLIMNFLSSAVFAITCGLIYKYKRTFSGAILSVVMSVVTVSSVMLLANIFITPYYMGVTTKEVLKLLPTVLLPFNMCKAILNASAVLVIYKPIKNALKRTGLIEYSSANSLKNGKKTFVMLVVSVIVIILTVLFLILHLGGSFELV